MYTHGQGVPKSYSKALFWRRKAADQGDAKAQYDLGVMYFSGEGVLQDYAEAIRWYQKSASQGYASGQYGLGFLYFHGYGVPRDRGEADRWFKKAADQGDPDARDALGSGLTPWRELALVIEVLGGLLLIIGFLSARKNRVDARRGIWLATGILCLLTAGISWYGYAHYLTWRAFGISTFPLIKWFLDVVLVALLIIILRSKNDSVGRIEAS